MTGDYKYSGAVAVNGMVYFVPLNEDNIGVLDTTTDTFSTINITDIVGTGEFKYVGAVAVNGTVYFAPYSQNNVGVLDTGCPA